MLLTRPLPLVLLLGCPGEKAGPDSADSAAGDSGTGDSATGDTDTACQDTAEAPVARAGAAEALELPADATGVVYDREIVARPGGPPLSLVEVEHRADDGALSWTLEAFSHTTNVGTWDTCEPSGDDGDYCAARTFGTRGWAASDHPLIATVEPPWWGEMDVFTVYSDEGTMLVQFELAYIQTSVSDRYTLSSDGLFLGLLDENRHRAVWYLPADAGLGATFEDAYVSGPGENLKPVGDVDGDGRDDVLVEHLDAALLWNGNDIPVDGGIAAAQNLSPETTPLGALGDLDGDGYREFALQDTSGEGAFEMEVFSHEGVRLTTILPGEDLARVESVFPVGDIDGDGGEEAWAELTSHRGALVRSPLCGTWTFPEVSTSEADLGVGDGHARVDRGAAAAATPEQRHEGDAFLARAHLDHRRAVGELRDLCLPAKLWLAGLREVGRPRVRRPAVVIGGAG